MPSRILLVLATAIVTVGWTHGAFAQATESPRFDIQRFVVEGNTILPQAEVEQIVAPFAGSARDFGDVQRALEALQDTYHDRGYSATRVLIPEQDLKAGEVRLQVLESRIRNIRVEGNKFFDEANVRASLPSVVSGEPPNMRRVNSNIQLANENPAKKVRVELAPSDEPGKVDAVVKVDDEKPSLSTVFLDNTGNSPTGYHRVGYGYQNSNMFNRDHVLSLQAMTSPTQISDVALYGAGYRVPLYSWNGAVDVFAGYSNVNSGTVGSLFTVSGAGSIFGIRYTQILPRQGEYEQKLVLGWDYRDFHNSVALVGTTATLVPDVTIKPLSLSYYGRLAQVGRDISFSAGYSQNLPGGADGGQTAFDATRAGASAHYGIWRLGAAYTQALPGDLLFRVLLSGQYTTNALVPGEQFGLGGADNVRGYFERSVANDTGHREQFEIYSPELGPNIGADWKARLLFFTDSGRGHDNQPVLTGDNVLGSLGFGIRANRGKSLALRFDYALVTHTVGACTCNANSRQEGQGRAHFSVSYSF
jgi:hemolysin activation/secretion protein